MNKLDQYDHATKIYIEKLIEGSDGNADYAELIPAAAEVQNSLSEITDLTAADREFVDAASAFIKALADVVKGRDVDNLESLRANYALTRSRVIIGAPVDSRHDYYQVA